MHLASQLCGADLPDWLKAQQWAAVAADAAAFALRQLYKQAIVLAHPGVARMLAHLIFVSHWH